MARRTRAAAIFGTLSGGPTAVALASSSQFLGQPKFSGRRADRSKSRELET